MKKAILSAIASIAAAGATHADLQIHTNTNFEFTLSYYHFLSSPPAGTSLNIRLDAASQAATDEWPLDENAFGIWADGPSSSSGWGNYYFFDDGDAKVTKSDEITVVDNGYYQDWYTPVTTFSPGESVGPESFTDAVGRDILTFSWEGPINHSPIDGMGFVGVSIVIEGQTHYGWVLMVDDYPAGSNYQPIAWAFETEPGVPALVVDPFESECLADVNGDGMLSPTDFTAWVGAFNNNEPGCDQNNDGACTPTDFSAWVANFNDGC